LTEGAESIAGVPLALPAILIETVSAGGGSIASVDEAARCASVRGRRC
jgi:N-methylhydantoinase A/oxoprolinase/acetone carboxylase beta subunit